MNALLDRMAEALREVGKELWDKHQRNPLSKPLTGRIQSMLVEHARRADGVQEGGAAVSDVMAVSDILKILGTVHRGEADESTTRTIAEKAAIALAALQTLLNGTDAALAAPSPDEQPKGASDEPESYERRIARIGCACRRPDARACAGEHSAFSDRFPCPCECHQPPADRATTGAREEPVAFRPGAVVEHRKGGKYVVEGICTIEATMTEAYAYRSEHEGRLWIRPCAEMEDGRFTQIGYTAPPEGTRAGASGVTEAMRDAAYHTFCNEREGGAGDPRTVGGMRDRAAIVKALEAAERARAPVSRSGDAGGEGGV